MGKAVGGASAAGCGIFGVGSLLIGVGLTVWLGSMALSGSTGGGSNDRTTTTAAALPASAAITVTPPGGLVDGGKLVLAGTGFEAGPLVVTTCLSHPPADLADPCDPALDRKVTVPAGGAWSLTVPAPRTIEVGGTAYDCAAFAAACTVFAGIPDTTAAIGAAVEFAEATAPVDAIAPPTS